MIRVFYRILLLYLLFGGYNLNLTIKIPENVFSSVNSEKCIILNYENGSYYGLDSIGNEYWDLMNKYNDFNLIVEKMLIKYPDVSKEIIESDLSELIEKLTKNELITVIQND